MNARRTRLIVLIALASALSGRAAAAHESKDRVKVDWKRDPKVSNRSAEAPAPAPPELPADLAPGTAPATTQAPPHVEPSRIARRPGEIDPDEVASRAGEDAAREAARVYGFREYWRAGFGRGVNAALNDSRVGRWDHAEGVRFGRIDPGVRALGDHLANEAAAGVASNEAEARVRDRFMDLSHEPRRDRADARGQPPPGMAPRFDGPYAMEPILGDVFVGYPPIRTPGMSREGRRAIEEWRVEPAYFAREEGRSRSYDARWKDPDAAFARWRERQGRGSYWSRLSPPERDRFRAVFCDRFEATLRAIDMRNARAAWQQGFDDGWRYGAAIQCEWEYRRGYAEGFDSGVREVAAIAFPYAYDRAYSDAYEHWFDEWSRSAHPGLGGVRLSEETGDGVFEPGERVQVEVDLVNYGGGPGTFDLIASGSGLDQPVTSTVRMGGRGRLSEAQRLSVRVADRTAPRSRSAVIVTIADARVDAPLYVSYPFEIDGAPTVDADRLEGRVTLSFLVANTSRRDARAVVRIEPLTGRRDAKTDDLGVIAAGGSRRSTVTFDGIHPLDLIGGESRWRATVTRGDDADDAKDVRIAPVATDLSNPDLMDFMIAMAGLPQVSRADVKDARTLMMERLRADWERAADGSGNPYKNDFETEGISTVLGQLVRVTQEGQRTFASPQVFNGLDRDIDALADDLPGAHPLLRKWMKKLAKRVG